VREALDGIDGAAASVTQKVQQSLYSMVALHFTKDHNALPELRTARPSIWRFHIRTL